MPRDRPLCVNCAHFCAAMRQAPAMWGARWVDDPLNATCRLTDHVDGSGKSGQACRSQRLDLPGFCGPAGQHFTPASQSHAP